MCTVGYLDKCGCRDSNEGTTVAYKFGFRSDSRARIGFQPVIGSIQASECVGEEVRGGKGGKARGSVLNQHIGSSNTAVIE